MRATSALFFACVACSEYEFASPSETGPRRPPHEGRGGDTELADTGGDNAGGEVEVPGDTGLPADGCFEPEDGYDLNPAARIVTDDSATPIVITYVYSDTAYQDELWIDSPESGRLAQSWVDGPGLQYTVGPWAAGTEVVFGLQVQTTGDHWQSGPGSRNADGVVHGAATFEGDCTWLLGFEDLYGGGDRDYNDLVFRVHGRLRQEE